MTIIITRKTISSTEFDAKKWKKDKKVQRFSKINSKKALIRAKMPWDAAKTRRIVKKAQKRNKK